MTRFSRTQRITSTASWPYPWPMGQPPFPRRPGHTAQDDAVRPVEGEGSLIRPSLPSSTAPVRRWVVIEQEISTTAPRAWPRRTVVVSSTPSSESDERALTVAGGPNSSSARERPQAPESSRAPPRPGCTGAPWPPEGPGHRCRRAGGGECRRPPRPRGRWPCAPRAGTASTRPPSAASPGAGQVDRFSRLCGGRRQVFSRTARASRPPGPCAVPAVRGIDRRHVHDVDVRAGQQVLVAAVGPGYGVPGREEAGRPGAPGSDGHGFGILHRQEVLHEPARRAFRGHHPPPDGAHDILRLFVTAAGRRREGLDGAGSPAREPAPVWHDCPAESSRRRQRPPPAASRQFTGRHSFGPVGVPPSGAVCVAPDAGRNRL